MLYKKIKINVYDSVENNSGHTLENNSSVENNSGGILENNSSIENNSGGTLENYSSVENNSGGRLENERLVLYECSIVINRSNAMQCSAV